MRLAGSLLRAVEGDVVNGSLMSGQVACLINEVKPCAQIMDELMGEACRWGGLGLEQMAQANASRSWKEAR